MESGTDISRVISAIMQNPELISEIKSLVEKGAQRGIDEEEPQAQPTVSEKTEPTELPSASYAAQEAPAAYDSSKKRRRELMRALKPYVSSERSAAIDTMLSIVDVFSILREK